MRPRARADEGSAVVEFFYLGVVLLVPVVYVMLTVFSLQRAALAVSAAAREAGRAYATAPDHHAARMHAERAARLTMEDHGLEFLPSMLVLSEGTAFRPGERVLVTVHYEAPLPLLGALFASGERPAIDVTGEHLATLDEFRSG